ncbi:CHAT domain-containing protein [Nonomuraea guangzhouensis]|uniref:CHAT domain-containing protein n=1 Tax=Nonomuraea guangzhouensis TaxID=1291555 RepID=A0ABW4GQP1_9ACTN|nr:CHAT domain-containing protein [Nonomuraea guangzhouensis]
MPGEQARRSAEQEVRRLVEAALALLNLLVPDPAAARRIRSELIAALALPPGRAEIAALTVLAGNPVLADWMREQRKRRYRDVPRHLFVSMPEQITVGREFSVVAWVARSKGDHQVSAPLTPFDVGRQGTAITVTVEAPGLVFLEHQRIRLRVPQDEDSAPVEFGLRGMRTGAHDIHVRAFESGRFLGGVSARTIVHEDAVPNHLTNLQGELPSTPGDPGQVTLEVSQVSGGKYSFHLLGPGLDDDSVVRRLGGGIEEVVKELVAELSKFANNSPYSTTAARRDRLRNLGVDLWRRAVPEEIRARFWELADGISSFAVLNAADTLPWELLHPMDGHHDRGFLVDQFPVVRAVDGQEPAGHLSIRSAAYVTSKRAPRNASDEIRGVQELLGTGVHHRGHITTLGQLSAMLVAPPSVLHFSCHHEFNEQSGSVLRLDEGPFRPSDLATAVAKSSLINATPIVFLNACRTAAEVRRLSRPMGWASQFMAAGAGVFLGTLWPLQSGSARTFAEAFYESFAKKKKPLGRAVSDAREQVRKEDGDPTWLAYTVYGDPAVRVGVPDQGAS